MLSNIVRCNVCNGICVNLSRQIAWQHQPPSTDYKSSALLLSSTTYVKPRMSHQLKEASTMIPSLCGSGRNSGLRGAWTSIRCSDEQKAA